MAEDQTGAVPPKLTRERRKAFLGEVERIEVDGAIEEEVPQPPLPAEVQIVRVPPRLGDALAAAVAGPFVGANGAGGFPLHGRFVDANGERHSGGTRRPLYPQFGHVVTTGNQGPFVSANVALGENWERVEIVEGTHIRGMDTGFSPRGPVVWHGFVGVF